MYEKGDKFKVTIEGKEKYFRYIDEVIEHVENFTYFEVDSHALSTELKYTDKNDKVKMREDCEIERIA